MYRWLGLAGVFCLATLARADAPAIAASVDGPLLLGELNCVACHAADASVAMRVMPHASPSLASAGQRLTPQYIRAIISDPQRAKPGSAMPNVASPDAIESLVQYVASLGGPAQPSPADAASPALIAEGERLYHTIGCVACHAPFSPPPKAAEEERAPTEIPKLTRASVPLGDLASKTTLTALTAYLIDPLKTHSAGRMPSMKLTQPEAWFIAAYLLRDQVDAAKPAPVLGLTYALYDGRYDEKKGFDKLKSRQEGVLADLKRIDPAQDYTLRLTGQLAIDLQGKYTLTFAIRDQVKLFLDGKKVDLKGGRRDKTMEAIIELTPGQHPIELVLSQRAGVPILESTWILPGEKNPKPIPPAALTHLGSAMTPKGGFDFQPDAAKVRQGKALFASLNCAACHAVDETKPNVATPLAKLNAAKPGGCLDVKPAAGRPAYALSDAQRADLARSLADLQKQTQLPDEKMVAEYTFKAFNCGACHVRQGSFAPDAGRLPYFHIDGDG